MNYFALFKWSNKSIECGRLLLKPINARFVFKCQVRFKFTYWKLGEVVMVMLSWVLWFNFIFLANGRYFCDTISSELYTLKWKGRERWRRRNKVREKDGEETERKETWMNLKVKRNIKNLKNVKREPCFASNGCTFPYKQLPRNHVGEQRISPLIYFFSKMFT